MPIKSMLQSRLTSMANENMAVSWMHDRKSSINSNVRLNTLKASTSETQHERNTWLGSRFGLLTAGDDSQAMNAAIRAVVRTGMFVGSTVVYIKHGIKGLVEGGDNFEQATWISTNDILGRGGTILKSVKCPEFVDKPARIKAAENLIKNGISKLIGIGGDGTLTALNILHDEWPDLLMELEDRKLVHKDVLKNFRTLSVVVIISSVEHDICGSDVSIGLDTALTRIVEATDALVTTAGSSQHAFVVEVMGKYSGHLALMSGIASDASMVFLPEWPSQGDWKTELTDKVKEDIGVGKEAILVIVADGATDINRVPIKATDIRDVLTSRLRLETQVTVLGRVQRGGSPSASDRFLATRMGAQSVLVLRDLQESTKASAIGIIGNDVMVIPITSCLERNAKLKKALAEGNFTEAVQLRGPMFQSFLSSYITLHSLQPHATLKIPSMSSNIKTIGILKLGKSPLGHCIVTKAVVGYCQSLGYKVLGIDNGFEGLVQKRVCQLDWKTVKRWAYLATDGLGHSVLTAQDVGLRDVADALRDLDVSGLILIGSFSAYASLHQMWKTMDVHKPFCIPMLLVPVTILNNIPGTEYTIGADSALNEVVSYCEKLNRVARSRRNCMFVVETMGMHCGFLALVGALCVGADTAYTDQHPFNLTTLLKDAARIKRKIMKSKAPFALVIRSEYANEHYNSDFLCKLFQEEGKGEFDCRQGKVGYVQMGAIPSAFDRLVATTLGLVAGERIINQMEDAIRPDGSVYTNKIPDKSVLCSKRALHTFKTMAWLSAETDFVKELPTNMWWKHLKTLLRVLQHEYEHEDGPDNEEDDEEEEGDEDEGDEEEKESELGDEQLCYFY